MNIITANLPLSKLDIQLGILIPTARWVFQAFDGIHLLPDGSREVVLNVEERYKRIVTVLGHR